MSETELVSACKKYLRFRGYYCQRIPSGLIRQVDWNGKERWVHLADKGTPDILACIPDSKGRGFMVGIEVKANEAAKKKWHASVKKAEDMIPLKKHDETSVAQHEQMKLIENSGGYTALVASLEELEHVIETVIKK